MPLKYAEDVASEIWENCWALAERDDLPALSLTCHLFNDICKPKLFQRLTFSLPSPRSRSFRGAAPTIGVIKRRYEVISNNHGLSNLIRLLSFGPRSISSMPVVNLPSSLAREEQLRMATAEYNSLLDIISSSISRFSRLQQIFVGPIPLGVKLMENLRPLKHLYKIHLATTSGINVPNGTPPLQVREFSYHEHTLNRNSATPIIAELPAIVASEHLQRLSISGIHAYVIIYSFILHRRIFESLRFLSVSVKPSDISLFFDFLLTCPALEKLHITNYHDLSHVASADLPPIPISAAPRLTDYTGPDAIAVALAPGRPMSMMALVNVASATYELTTADYTSLGRSSPPMTSLNLGLRYMNRTAFHDLARYLPHLQKLTVHIEETDDSEFTPEDAILYLDLLSLGAEVK
ncbi:hypothetical protein CPB83DRAFT_856040 [Crepidotus variabilis]|uniref:Uncharacterized protein n=1 Tax=Crepidotus variabilis TaxID=179855 RepID=A0A9P6EEJ5_9AGAR|nr:hypothetical protein CPB83DRAFT_856040 [Crepidotus variabilis]